MVVARSNGSRTAVESQSNRSCNYSVRNAFLLTTSMMLVSRSPTRTGRESVELPTGRMRRLYSLFFSLSSYSRLAWKRSCVVSSGDVVTSTNQTTTAIKLCRIAAGPAETVNSATRLLVPLARYYFRRVQSVWFRDARHHFLDVKRRDRQPQLSKTRC